jgi:hypothetical protein
MLARVPVHLFRGPVHQRVDFDPAIHLLDPPQSGARPGLFSPEARRPGFELQELTRQGPDLADIATHLPAFHGAVEEIRSVAGHHPLHFITIRRDHFDRGPVAGPNGLHHLVSFVWQAARVQGKNSDAWRDSGGEIDDGHPFLLKAGGNGERLPERGDSPCQGLRRR